MIGLGLEGPIFRTFNPAPAFRAAAPAGSIVLGRFLAVRFD
jgi:hypothetical protein